MNKEQAFKEITSTHKWYIGKYSQGYASQLIQRFNSGQLKDKTIDAFLNKFGYFKIKEAEYGKQ